MDQPIGSIDCFCGVSDAIEIIRQGHTEVPKKNGLYDGRRPGVQQPPATDQLPVMT